MPTSCLTRVLRFLKEQALRRLAILSERCVHDSDSHINVVGDVSGNIRLIAEREVCEVLMCNQAEMPF